MNNVLWLLVVMVNAALLAAQSPSSKINVPAGRQANIFVSFVGGTSASIQAVNNARFQNRDARLNYLHDTLVANAERSQEGVRKFLASRGNVEFRSFWITNQVFVRNADSAIIEGIAQDPKVSSIDEEIIIPLIEPVEIKNATLEDEHPWGVVKIQAPEAWQERGFPNGHGVVVATIDIGVRETHEALRDNFVGDYGWFDPIAATPTPRPYDLNDHGTHIMGSIVGAKGIGVAPGAKWATCRGCHGTCHQSGFIACGEFFTCPTLADGTNPNCSRAPHLVSNSWSGGRGHTWFNGVIDAWHAAGIIPLATIGSSGPSCNTANSPGDHDVIGVGSTTIDDAITSFSSLGPTSDGRMKPEIVAPGENVISAFHTSDTAYVAITGGSVSCPHAAGTVALLQTRNKDLTYQQVKDFLFENADQNLQFSGRVCSGIGDHVFPNHVFGYGRINALRSVRAQTPSMQI